MSTDAAAGPRTAAGLILLREHSSGTPHMERHILAIENEARAAALDEAYAAAKAGGRYQNGSNILSAALAAIDALREKP